MIRGRIPRGSSLGTSRGEEDRKGPAGRASPVSGSPKKASSSLRPLSGAAGAGSSSGSRGKLVMLM